MELSDQEIELLEGILSDVRDDLRHYMDGDKGWSRVEVDAFWSMNEKFREEAKRRGFWWAR